MCIGLAGHESGARKDAKAQKASGALLRSLAWKVAWSCPDLALPFTRRVTLGKLSLPSAAQFPHL